AAVAELVPGFEPEAAALPALLEAASKRLLDAKLLVILDQFDEYFIYHARDGGEGSFAEVLARAVNDFELRANFLISIREDALAKLDRFQGEIPSLFDNYLRVKHLSRNGAKDAIRKPLAMYNELSDGEPYDVEEDLVAALLDELRIGRVVVGLTGVGTAEEAGDADEADRVETPYLQLVMTRLWQEEVKQRSTVLQATTLDRLGRSERIVKTHLDETMQLLPRYGQYVAARVFHYLVTPSGTKIAHTARDLGDYVGLPEADVQPVLEKLTAGDFRILRRVTTPGAENGAA